MRWDDEGRDWPNRDASRFVRAANMRWHVQDIGGDKSRPRPAALLIHGAGSATHTWRALAPLLATRLRVVAIDLPGHGFSDRPPPFRASMAAISRAVGELLRAFGVSPAVVVGHSAGAALLARMCLDRHIAPACFVALNGAFLAPRGLMGQFFSPAAKLAVSVPFLPLMLALQATDRGIVERLLRDTGSTIEPRGVELYARLVRSPQHVGGALAMMANWDLASLRRDLPRLRTRLTMIVGSNDRTVSPNDASLVRGLVPHAAVVAMRGLGHLSHEERPAETAALIIGAAAAAGVMGAENAAD